jgi:hypothetical protein
MSLYLSTTIPGCRFPACACSQFLSKETYFSDFECVLRLLRRQQFWQFEMYRYLVDGRTKEWCSVNQKNYFLSFCFGSPLFRFVVSNFFGHRHSKAKCNKWKHWASPHTWHCNDVSRTLWPVCVSYSFCLPWIATNTYAHSRFITVEGDCF